MKPTQTLQPAHLVARLELLEADHALGLGAVFADAVLLRRAVDQHTTARHAALAEWCCGAA